MVKRSKVTVLVVVPPTVEDGPIVIRSDSVSALPSGPAHSIVAPGELMVQVIVYREPVVAGVDGLPI